METKNDATCTVYIFLILILLEGAVCCGMLFASLDVEVLYDNY